MARHLPKTQVRPSLRLDACGPDHKKRDESHALDGLPALLTVREVAQVLRRSEAGTYGWLRAGGLRHLRIEGTIRVLRVDLEEFLTARSTNGRNDPEVDGHHGDRARR